MKKILIIAVALVALAGAAVYFFVLAPTPELPPVTFSPGDYFVTNVKDSNRLLKAAVVLVLDTDKAYKKLPARLDANVAGVRDTIIFILRELDEDEIRADGVEDDLRKRISAALNTSLETEGVKTVLFSDFVMQ